MQLTAARGLISHLGEHTPCLDVREGPVLRKRSKGASVKGSPQSLWPSGETMIQQTQPGITPGHQRSSGDSPQ
jgi:hypothetical protein